MVGTPQITLSDFYAKTLSIILLTTRLALEFR